MNHIKLGLLNDILPWLIAVGGMFFICLLLPVNFIPANDTIARYIPMARAFAEGNWDYAFHPHSGILFSLISGVLNMLPGVGAFRACQLAAVMLWGLAAVPLYYITLYVWHKRDTAVVCSVLYLLCSHLHRYVYDGIRDNGRSLGFFLLVLGILICFEKKDSWRSSVITAAGSAILTMIRVDCVVFGCAGLIFLFIMDAKNHGWRCQRGGVALVLWLLLISPQLYLNYRWSGYPVPNSRYAILCKKIGLPPLGEPK